ncbi:MAG: hypothetical protein IPO62_17230 [Saprospiraceae bacterium]|nr:hypothetical protein [Saprospiraceae bacterium]MBK9632768.1 hypothetical protein [Saprospiraceae bacterium]
MFGNIFILFILVIYGFLANLLLSPRPGGDYGVGYSFVFMIYSAAFIISTGLLAWNMSLNHCFDWISGSFLKYRNWLVFLGWFSFVLASLWSLEYSDKKVDSVIPSFMNLFTWSRIYFWLPILILVPCVYFLNVQEKMVTPAIWPKIMLQTGFSFSLLISMVLFGVFIIFKVKGQVQHLAARVAQQSERVSNYNASYDYINNYNEATIDGLLKYVYPENEAKRRNAAISKIISFPNWENDLIRILTEENLEQIYVFNDDTYYVFAFLDEHKVEHPAHFIQPIIYSLNVMAKRIRESLSDPYNLELSRSDIELVCRVLEAQFKMAVKEFRPSMLKLKAILEIDPPERMNKQHIKSYRKRVKAYRMAVKNWLESNG